MPANEDFDFLLGGNGYILSRPEVKESTGQRVLKGPRSWVRSGQPDTPSRKNLDDVSYGNLPDVVDHPEVWDDWSAGFGDYYRTEERRNAFSFSFNFDARFPKQLVHAQVPQAITTASININADSFLDVPLPSVNTPPAGAGEVLVLGRGYVAGFSPTQYQNTAGSAFMATYEATGGGALAFGHKPAIFGSFTMIPNLNGSSFYMRGHDGATYTIGPAESARWFQVANGRLWWERPAAGQLTSIAPAVDPLSTGNYAATLNIGNGQLQSDAAIALNDQLFVGLPDGLYPGNLTGTFNNVLPDIGAAVNVDNVRDMTVHGGAVVAPVANHVYWFRPGTGANNETREIGPAGLGANRSAIRGTFTCVKGYGKWLLAGLFTGSQSYILAGRDASYPLPYVWSPMQLLPTTCKVSRIHIDGISVASSGVRIPQRMWIATDASFGAKTGATAPLYVMPIPQGFDNPIADMTFSPNYCGSARIDMGVSDWSMPATTKVFRAVEIQADNLLSGAQYIDVYYAIDGGPQQLLGTATTSPRSVLFFPGLNNPNSAAFIRGSAFQLSLQSFTASANVTPVIRSAVVRGLARPSVATEITAKARIADGMHTRGGQVMRSAQNQITELRAMAISDQPQKLVDLTGVESWAAVVPPIEETEVYQLGSDNPEIEATIRMAIMDFTTNYLTNAGTNNSLANYTNDQLAQYTNAALAFL